MPVADHRQHEEHDRDEKKPGRFRGVNGMVLMPLSGVVLGRLGGHGPIVAPKSISFLFKPAAPCVPCGEMFDFPGTELTPVTYLRLTGGVGVLARRRIL